MEHLFETNKMKDAWNGLKILTGQKEDKKASSLTSTPGAVDWLNHFYSRFDKDFSSTHQTMRNELLKQIPTEPPITVTQSDVHFILKSINANKSTWA